MDSPEIVAARKYREELWREAKAREDAQRPKLAQQPMGWRARRLAEVELEAQTAERRRAVDRELSEMASRQAAEAEKLAARITGRPKRPEMFRDAWELLPEPAKHAVIAAGTRLIAAIWAEISESVRGFGFPLGIKPPFRGVPGHIAPVSGVDASRNTARSA